MSGAYFPEWVCSVVRIITRKVTQTFRVVKSMTPANVLAENPELTTTIVGMVVVMTSVHGGMRCDGENPVSSWSLKTTPLWLQEQVRWSVVVRRSTVYETNDSSIMVMMSPELALLNVEVSMALIGLALLLVTIVGTLVMVRTSDR